MGGESNGAVSLGLNGTTKTLSLSSHTHDFSGTFITRKFAKTKGTTATAPLNYIWLCRLGNPQGYSGKNITLRVESRYFHTYSVLMNIATGSPAYNSTGLIINTLGKRVDDGYPIYYKLTKNGSDIGWDYVDIYVKAGSWNTLSYDICGDEGSNGSLNYEDKREIIDALPDGVIEIMENPVKRAYQDGSGNTISSYYLPNSYNLWETISS